MDYIQMTLTDWQNMKKEIERDLLNVKMAFVRIGYNLRQIEEQELYRQDGYNSIAEFAKAEYNLSASTVSRFMAINRRFSLNGNSQLLDARFTLYSSSALQEMLTLPDDDLDLITPETKRETIRDIKKFNAQQSDTEDKTEAQTEELPEESSPLRGLIKEFFHQNPKLLDRLYQTDGFPDGDTAELREIVNPSGSRSVRNGPWIMIMNESDLKYKPFGGKAETLTWEEFMAETDRIYADLANQTNRSNILGREEGEENGGTGGTGAYGTSEETEGIGGDEETDRNDQTHPGRDTKTVPEDNERTGREGDRKQERREQGKENDQEQEELGAADETDREKKQGSGEEVPEETENDKGDRASLVAPAQNTEEDDGREEVESPEKAGTAEGELKTRMIETAERMLGEIKAEDWKGAKEDLQLLGIWMETAQEAKTENEREEAMALAIKYGGRGKKKGNGDDSGGNETAEGEEPEIQEADRSVHEP